MKFFLDQCVGRRLADWLRDRGHDVVEARDRGKDPGDRILLQWAASEERILVTMDKDFGEFVFAGGDDHAGLVRLPDVPAAGRIALMERVLKNHVDDLTDRCIVTVRGGRIRVSRSPSR